MTPRPRPLALVVALSALLISAPAYASVMGVQMFVNGQLVATETVEPDPEGPVPLEFDARDTGFLIDGSALLDVDPFIDYSLGAFNFTENALLFSFVFLSPYAGGPYDTLLHDYSSTVTDSDGSGAAAVFPSDASGMSIPQIDGADVVAAALGDGCTPEGMTPGDTVPCDPFSSTSVSVVTLPDGFFGVGVSFFLSGGDAANLEGRVEILNQQPVPEPTGLVLLGLGAVTALGRRSLSRYRR